LGLTLGFEPLHFALSSSDWKVRVLNPVVVPQSPWLMPVLATKDIHRGLV
jgi:hypothetical protein